MSDTLQVLSLEYDSKSNMFVKHVRSIIRLHDEDENSDNSNCDDDDEYFDDDDDDSFLEALHGILKCEYVNCADFEIDDEVFNVWFDDNFLEKPKPIPTFYLDEYQIIYNNLVFTKTDDEGNTLGLTAEEMSKVWIFYLRHFHLLIKYLAEYHTENFLLNIAINDHCLPTLKGIYKSFKQHFRCEPVDEQFKKFGVIS